MKMTNREYETRYIQMKLTWKNLVNANIDLLDENKMLKEENEQLKQELREEKEASIRMYNMYVEVLEDLKNGKNNDLQGQDK